MFLLPLKVRRKRNRKEIRIGKVGKIGRNKNNISIHSWKSDFIATERRGSLVFKENDNSLFAK